MVNICFGLDVARYGDCSSALCIRSQEQVTFRTFDSLPLNILAKEVVAIVKSFHDKSVVYVDATGVGGGAYDCLVVELKGLKLDVKLVEVNFAGKPPMVDGVRLANDRAYIYYQMKRYLQHHRLIIPEVYKREIVDYLGSLECSYDPRQRLLLDRKARNLGIIADLVDSLALTFYE